MLVAYAYSCNLLSRFDPNRDVEEIRILLAGRNQLRNLGDGRPVVVFIYTLIAWHFNRCLLSMPMKVLPLKGHVDHGA